MLKIKVILGSTRPNRFGIQPAEWITKLGEQHGDGATFELVDLKEINLPLLDIAMPPSMVPSNQNDHQAAWAKVIGDADGFIFVTPEYNHSFPAALKNAIDFVSHEWNNKPVGFVSYGVDGGIRAIEHLRAVVSWLQMHDVHYFVNFPNYFAGLDKNGKFQFTEAHEEKAKNMLNELIFLGRRNENLSCQIAYKHQVKTKHLTIFSLESILFSI